jgi:alpha-galactosidase
MDTPAALEVHMTRPCNRFTAVVGIDCNPDTQRSPATGSARFHVIADGQRVYMSPVLRMTDGAHRIDLPLEDAREIVLEVDDGGDGLAFDQCTWAEAAVSLVDGTRVYVSDLPGLVEKGRRLPFSFTYNGESSEDLLPSWEYSMVTRSDNGGRLVRDVVYRDPDTGLRVTCEVTTFRDHAMTDWICRLTNEGEVDTPLIEDFRPLHGAAFLAQSDNVTLRWSRGDRHLPPTTEIPVPLPSYETFLYTDTSVAKGTTHTFRSVGAHTHLPFFNLYTPQGGFVLGVGWTLNWEAEFARNEADGGVTVSVGMPTTRFRLHPGEEVRGPRIALFRWTGTEAIHGHNQFRRALMRSYLRRDEHGLIAPPIAFGNTAECFRNPPQEPVAPGRPTHLTLPHEKRALEQIRTVAAWGCEVYWMDAYCWPWYFDQHLGDWQARPEDFPRGLKPLSDAAHEQGMRYLQWFATYRVAPGTECAGAHGRHLHGDARNGGFWRLGDEVAREVLVERMARLIEENGIDIYREDYGIGEPRDTDPDRVGVAEMKHVAGYYAFLDALIERFPTMPIDICNGGGNNIDFETILRGMPLWRSDLNDIGEGLQGPQNYNRMATADQVMVTGLSLYVPFHTGALWQATPYGTRSAASGGFVFYNDVSTPEFRPESAAAAVAETKSLRPLFQGDLYPLLTLNADHSLWYALQLDRPETGDGCVLVYRRVQSGYTGHVFHLYNIKPEAVYEVRTAGESFDESPWEEIPGSRLLEWRVEIPEPAQSFLLRYRRRSGP